MSDPFLILGRLLMLGFVPMMLLAPLVFSLLVPNRATDDSSRIQARGRMLVLALCTITLLLIWLGLLIVGTRFPRVLIVANFWWVWFFPLWFILAFRAIQARNPNWTGAIENRPDAKGLRTASLVNRERQSPVTRAMWLIPLTVFVVFLAAIAARGLQPFPAGAYPGDSAADPEAAKIAYAAVERSRWILALVIYGGLIGFQLVFLPYSLRRTLTEPEPLDSSGSVELAELYSRQRRKRVLGLFWGGGVIMPFFAGLFITLQTWYPSLSSLWGLVGGIGGSVIGIGGAAFGIQMTIERARIAEVRARLNSSH